MMHRFTTTVLALVAIIMLAHPFTAGAQETQVLSVTPPLFQITVNPGDTWQSVVKVVNSNKYDLHVYAQVVNFAPKGEEGQGEFVPILDGDEVKATLAEWITLSSGPYIISPEQSAEIPFTVVIPNDASPGGHFAAILISTEEPRNENSESSLLTTQTVTSLFFVRVNGDINERGDIREFSVTKSFVDVPEAEFSLRFENKGNVHLRPQGNIKITNMWGTERGNIPINNRSNYGNVLPTSIRDFRFTWKGEQSITDIGRYKAVAVLGYGEDGIKSADSTVYFWVIPVKATLITLGVLFAFIYFVTWAIRRYVRRMLALAGVDVNTMEHVGTAHTIHDARDVHLNRYKTVAAPLTTGARDLQERLSGTRRFFDSIVAIVEFVWYYKLFFISVVVLVGGFIGAVLYINDASEDGRSYEVRIQEGDQERILKSDDIETAKTSE